MIIPASDKYFTVRIRNHRAINLPRLLAIQHHDDELIQYPDPFQCSKSTGWSNVKSTKQTPMQHTIIATGRAPLYMEAARLIKQRIKQGAYPTGSALPSIRQLSKALGLSHNAVQRAIQQLETERIVESQHGVGVKVMAAEDCATTAHWIALVQPYHSLASVTLQRGLEQAMEDRSNFCVVKTTDNDPQRERQVIDHLIANGINGLLLWPVDNDQNVQYLQDVAKQVPTVLVDRQVSGLQVPSVVHDYHAAGLDMADYLYEHGARKIMVICDPVAISTFDELKQSIRQRCDQLGIGKKLQLVDEPVLKVIYACIEGDFRLAHECAAKIKPMFMDGKVDAVICPQGQYVEYVLCQSGLYEHLSDLPIATFRQAMTSRDVPQMNRPNIAQWTMDQLDLFKQAIAILDQAMIKGNNSTRVHRVQTYRDTWKPPVD
jgi:DNA-binding LacI/PurR family transcriptional regulator